MIIYGRNPVVELLRRKPELVEEVLLAREKRERDVEFLRALTGKSKLKMREMGAKELSAMTKSEAHQGFVARIREFPYADISEIYSEDSSVGFAVALDSIQDPQNLGALIRSAAAFGALGVIFPKDRSADLTPSAIKASAGLCFALPVAKVTNLARSLDELSLRGFWIIGAEAKEGEDISKLDLPGKKALVIGGEEKGLRRLVKEKCHKLVKIPMTQGVDSLNASAAGAIMMFVIGEMDSGQR
ncbi:MAG: 23S rRNA (guanosine(2251)-2'-O)-methyltransferase RlmB [Myxococcota bacterium]